MTPRADIRLPPTLAWGIGSILAVLFLGLAFLPPLVDGFARGALMHGFSFVCHQLPERSASIGGAPLALCHRCTGIFAGFTLGLVVGPLAVPSFVQGVKRVFSRVSPKHRALAVLLAAGVPTLVDWMLGASGLWMNTPVSRTVTGLFLGLVAGLLVARGLLEQRAVVMSSSPTLT
ncbi:DUF2085 domain-containing protein [Rubricoccus marinus]|uniref:DUF2085 domain-containing protein n=1 Tax=Rubricoccus marinus TaxID=716817 RepID=A0A259TYR9_9BACT|nr:DUF2085 domain-containing protein [Rubricoccus marinus]OZC02728.1 hypothetical protein BSZ36_06920 [Rubricoccus marinus]